MVGRLPCVACKKLYKITPLDNAEQKRLKEGGPKCDTCRVDLHKDNTSLVMLYSMCSNQCIMGGMGESGPVMQSAMFEIIDRYEVKFLIDDKLQMFEDMFFFSNEIRMHILRDKKAKAAKKGK